MFNGLTKEAVDFVRKALAQYTEDRFESPKASRADSYWYTRVKSLDKVLTGIAKEHGTRTKTLEGFAEELDAVSNKLARVAKEMRSDPITIEEASGDIGLAGVSSAGPGEKGYIPFERRKGKKGATDGKQK